MAMTLIESDSLTDAWVAAARATLVMTQSPLVVSLTDFDPLPTEDMDFRGRLDELLQARGRNKTTTTAKTIFPYTFWRPGVAREAVFDRYLRLFERRLRGVPANRRGTYFERMINHPAAGNQLNEVIEFWQRGIRRRSAFVVSTYDPGRDLIRSPRLGFPCLHQVCFAPEADGGMSVTGFYAMQYIFDRGYGNYLGLARLGQFVGHEMGLHLARVTCVASIATHGGIGKRDMRRFLDDAEVQERQ